MIIIGEIERDFFVYFCSAFLCVEGSSCCCEVGCSQWRQLYLPKGIGRTDCCRARDGHRFIFGEGSRFGTTSTLHSFLIPRQDWPQMPFFGGSPPRYACSVRRSVIPVLQRVVPEQDRSVQPAAVWGWCVPLSPRSPSCPTGGWEGDTAHGCPGCLVCAIPLPLGARERS